MPKTALRLEGKVCPKSEGNCNQLIFKDIYFYLDRRL
jgi:hypothetical protein